MQTIAKRITIFALAAASFFGCAFSRKAQITGVLCDKLDAAYQLATSPLIAATVGQIAPGLLPALAAAHQLIQGVACDESDPNLAQQLANAAELSAQALALYQQATRTRGISTDDERDLRDKLNATIAGLDDYQQEIAKRTGVRAAVRETF